MAQGSAWLAPARFAKPDAASDEGGLWAMMDREEARLRRSPFMLRDAPLRDYIQDIACKLAGEHCADVRVYPVRTPFFNASMAPNGMMQIWSGLLLRVDNEAQLAAVIGHEIGHYMQRHTLEKLRDVKARSAFGMFMGMFGVVGLVGQLAMLSGAFGFSRDQEREADGIGLDLMRKAGYDTREAAKVWENLRAEAAAAHDPSRSSPMFATHPASEERSATLARLAAADGGGFVGFTELSSRLAGLQQLMLEDELRRGQHGETLVLLDRLIARSPQRSDLLYFRGETRRQRAAGDDGDRALQDFEQALQLGQEPAQLHRALGYLYQGRAKPEQAREAFARYVELAPEAADLALIKSFL
ncbi:M48 family metallopeptidase [Roseateles albus]|uniref:M48 family metallopeptidase n=1 Tax=Roseateles albus TaxID=2987525 RepID=A0ABT5KAG5_9BURK|nr:M48 family metallopeptidase [Roseateles albus]MDC8770554.1 M48 family metallopeptidase [Roseateles albus]